MKWKPEILVINKGDSVKFIGMMGHDTQSMVELSPQGYAGWKSNMGEEGFTVNFDEKGVYFQNKDDSLYVPPLDLGNKVVDTSGAGDAFNGAFATALCEDKSIKDSLIFANTFAGISTTRVGTAKSMPSREEIDKLL